MHTEVYKSVGDVSLRLFIFLPAARKPDEARPAIVFFFGGGWARGTPRQFVPHCRYLASRSMVAITAEYRVHSRHGATVADCVADAQAAIRWVRAHARQLGVDPERIAAGGGSAGGHLAAATALLDDLTTDGGVAGVSCRPNALILFNPALDLTFDDGKGGLATRRRQIENRFGAEARTLSPRDHVRPGLPPTIIFHGREDALIPYAQMEEFAEAMRDAGNRCELLGFEGQGHGFFNFGREQNRYFVATMRPADRFLASLHYVKGKPAVDAFVESEQAMPPTPDGD